MPLFDETVAQLLADCERPEKSSGEKGAALEAFIASVFSFVPGIEVRATNAKSVFENEELDLVLENREADDGLRGIGPFFSVECKNWSRPVGSTEISWFATKLRRSGQKFGVLVAANGITGSNEGLNAAHFEAASALLEGQQIVVLTLQELRFINSGEQLADFLVEKLTRLIARREIYIETVWSEVSLRWMRFRASRLQRSTVLDEFLSGSGGIERTTLPNAVSDLYLRIDRFWDFGEEPTSPDGKPLKGAEESAWLDQHMKIFDAVGAAVRDIGLASIASLRSHDGYSTVKELETALDLRAPRNLSAGLDDQLSQLLLDHWTKQTLVGHFGDGPALGILSLSINWTIDIKLERWPPPWV